MVRLAYGTMYRSVYAQLGMMKKGETLVREGGAWRLAGKLNGAAGDHDRLRPLHRRLLARLIDRADPGFRCRRPWRELQGDDRRPQDGSNERPDAEKAMNRRHRRSAARLLDFRSLGVESDDIGAERRSEDERSHEQCRHAPGEDRDDAGGEECWEKQRHGRPRSEPRNERTSEQLRDDRAEPDVEQRKPEGGRIKLQPSGDRRNVSLLQRSDRGSTAPW